MGHLGIDFFGKLSFVVLAFRLDAVLRVRDELIQHHIVGLHSVRNLVVIRFVADVEHRIQINLCLGACGSSR